MKKKWKAVVVLVAVLALIGIVGYTDVYGIGENTTGTAQDIKLGLDLAGGVSITYQVVGDENPSAEDMSDTIYKLQRRVEAYSTEAQVYKEGSNRIDIEIPGVSDANTILQELGQPGTLYFIAQKDADGNDNYTMSYGIDANGSIGYTYTLNKTIEDLQEDGSIVLTGTDVATAQAGTYQNQMQNSEFVVSLTLTEDGAVKFADATQKAYDGQESIAIYYDGRFVSVPNVNSVISDGQAQITGMADFEEAENLASTIRIGGLKLELEELSSNVVGAQLGEQAISTSIKAGAVGFALVVVFMLAVYYLPGLAASIALSLYAVLVVLLLDAFAITLTLPGIAGIILSIGMAVDANVIIFARIREELATGKSVKSAVKIGFDKALSAIIDGNVTTLIAAAVLGLRGSGTIKGFAQTLALGIVLSMITALFVTKAILNAFITLGATNPKLFGVAKEKKTIGFLKKRVIFFIASAAVIVSGFVAMGINKGSIGNVLNYSLEFVGGTSTSVTFNEDLSLADIDDQVKPLFEEVTGDANVQATKVAGSNDVVIKTRTLNVEEREEIMQSLEDTFAIEEKAINQETISSTISSEMRSDAVVAVLIAAFCMLLYIWFRFKDIRFGASSVLALIHDCLIVLAFYAWFRVSVGSTFIACMLTIVGYSINATIVIFDRIRENLQGGSKKEDLEELVNRSVTQTLSRSIFSSLTTFFMVAALYVFGVSSIREFALPLMVGIVCGTYSSVCLTGAMWYVLRTKIKKATQKNK
ncbi:MAG: protein translocase subunit SecD [Lachnospiraceae bacterium]|nr:protein translocase subunit SecD [Lachnospiraceae bacterium]